MSVTPEYTDLPERAAKAIEGFPNAKDVQVRYMPGGHFWTLESPQKTTDAIRLLLTM